MRTLYAVLGLSLLMACSKDDNNNSNNNGNNGTDPLQPVRDAITGVWQGEDFGIQLSENGAVDSSSSSFADLSWQWYTFNADGTINIDSAGTAWGDGNWSLISEDEIAIMAQDAFSLDSMVLDISLLNTSRFEMSRDSSITFGGTTYGFQTFVHLKR